MNLAQTLAKSKGDVFEIKKILLEVLPTIFTNTNRKVNGAGWYNIMVDQHDLEIFRGHKIMPLYTEVL